jgi:hypothetical protein
MRFVTVVVGDLLPGQILSKTTQAGNTNIHYKLLIGPCDQLHKLHAKRDLALREL